MPVNLDIDRADVGDEGADVESIRTGPAAVRDRQMSARVGSLPMHVRELRPGEHGPIDVVFAGLSPRSRYLRFHTGMPRLPDAARKALVAVDGVRHVALIAEEHRASRPIGIARFVVRSPDSAELAIAVVDAWHRRGVGRRLLEELRQRAVDVGLRELTAMVLPHNEAVLGLLQDVFPGMHSVLDDGVVEVSCPLEPAVTGVIRADPVCC